MINCKLDVGNLIPWPWRGWPVDNRVEKLADHMEAHGSRVPVIVVVEAARPRILFGHCRAAAARTAELIEIPAIIIASECRIEEQMSRSDWGRFGVATVGDLAERLVAEDLGLEIIDQAEAF